MAVKKSNPLKSILWFAGYTIAFGASAYGFMSLANWAFEAGNGETVQYEGVVKLSDSVRREYLTNQAIDGTGIELEFTTGKGGSAKTHTVSGDKCTFSGDLSQAGIREVTVTYDYNEYSQFVGTYTVEVFKIRHISVESVPSATIDASGNLTVGSGLKILADLNKAPQTDAFPLAGTYDTVINIDPSSIDFQTKRSTDNENVYEISGSFDAHTVRFGYYNANGTLYNISSADRVMTFDNKSGSDDTLELVITKLETGSNATGQGTVASEGFYVYKNGSTVTTQPFSYNLVGWQSSFSSTDPYKIKQYGSGILATVNGHLFFAEQPVWHKTIIGWNTSDVGTTFEEQLEKDGGEIDTGLNFTATGARLVEENNKVYYEISGSTTLSKALFDKHLSELFFNVEGTYAETENASLQWKRFERTGNYTVNDDKTFVARFDVTDLKSYGYATHFGVKDSNNNVANLVLSADKLSNTKVTLADGSTYELQTGGANTQQGFWGTVALIVNKTEVETTEKVTINGTEYELAAERILTFTNQSSNGASLTLYVTKAYTNEDKTATGWYAYNDGTTTTYYAFDYKLSGWTSVFTSASGVTEQVDDNDGGSLKVTIGGTLFRAGMDEWHQAVLQGLL